MPLLALPNEIFLTICGYLEYESDINALSRVNWRLHVLVNPYLYKRLLCNSPISALAWAAEHGNVASVRKLLEAGVSADPSSDPSCDLFRTPLVLASRNGHAEIVEILCLNGISPNDVCDYVKDELEESWDESQQSIPRPLCEAAEFGHESVIRALLKHGADLEFPLQDGLTVRQPLNLAVGKGNVSVIKLLLESGCNPNTIDSSGYNALSCASNTDIEIVRILIDAGASWENNEPNYRYPLDLALNYDNLPLVKFFLELGANPNHREPIGVKFRDAAMEHPEIALLLLERIDVDQIDVTSFEYMSLVRGAAAAGFEDLMIRLLGNLPKGRVGDAMESCLEVAVVNGHTGTAKLLLDRGVNPNGRGPSTYSIACALGKGHDDVMKLLFDHGMEAFAPQFSGGPVHYHTAIAYGRVDVVRWLLEKGCRSKETYDELNEAAIASAVLRGEEMFKLMLQYGIKLEPGRKEHQKALVNAAIRANVPILKIFLEAGFDVESRDPDSINGFPSLLAMAAAAEDRDAAAAAVDLLLAHGANIEALDPMTDLTPLLYLCSQDGDFLSTDFPEERNLEQGARLLLERGADLLFTNRLGQSALSLAINQANHRPIVEVLLEFGADKPFEQFEDHVLAATSTEDPQVAKLLWHYYWRRVYPVDV